MGGGLLFGGSARPRACPTRGGCPAPPGHLAPHGRPGTRHRGGCRTAGAGGPGRAHSSEPHPPGSQAPPPVPKSGVAVGYGDKPLPPHLEKERGEKIFKSPTMSLMTMPGDAEGVRVCGGVKDCHVTCRVADSPDIQSMGKNAVNAHLRCAESSDSSPVFRPFPQAGVVFASVRPFCQTPRVESGCAHACVLIAECL